VCQNRVLWEIYVPKRDEVTVKGRKIYEEFNYLYSSLNIFG
jgi:hypothetical protein